MFAAEQRCIEESAPPVVWRRPSWHDADRLGDPLDGVVTSESHVEHPEVVGAGARRGVILQKLMEELLTGELAGETGRKRVPRARTARSTDLRRRRFSARFQREAAAALRGLALPQIAEL